MKSILVDALRQANGDDTDRALSDSGSFDTSQDTLAPPANDTIEEQHGELELMSTSSALVVREESEQGPEETVKVDESEANFQDTEADFEQVSHESIVYEPVDDEHAMTVAGMMPLPVTRRQAPPLARIAPLLCAVLAFTVAASWLLINKLGTSNASLGTTITQGDSVSPDNEPGSDPVPGSRFRFLDGDEASPAEGSM